PEDIDRVCERCANRRDKADRLVSRAKATPPSVFGLPTDIKAAALFVMIEGLSSEPVAVALIQAKARQLGGDIEGAVRLARETLMDAVHTIDAMVARVDNKASGNAGS